MLDRPAIVAHLDEIAALLELHGDNKFKARAFARGARALEASRDAIAKLVEERRLEELPGIGAAIARQIEDLYRSGRSEMLDSLRAGLPVGILELAKIDGIGLRAIKTLHEELGVGAVDDLRRAAEEGRLRGVKGFGAKKEAKILEAIARHETRANEAPVIALADGLRVAADLERAIGAVEGVASVHLAGSLGRSAELSSDVAIVAAADDPAGVASRIAASSGPFKTLRHEGGACALALSDGTRVEVTACAPRELPVVLARTRSSRGHWDKLVARAAARGLRLDDVALTGADGRRVSLDDEAALYAALGLPMVPPELREDSGEIEAAERGESFGDLVTLADLHGFVHCHTTWSDGKGSVEEMARAAKARSAEFITITDHSKAAFYAGGLDVERLERQWDEIDRVAELVGIRIFKGSEADILADGALDWPDRILERLDVVIASIHNRHHQDEAKMTERVLRAMRHPVFKIWGHPMGRLVSSRPPIPLRIEEVLDAIAESRGAIEINGDPQRLDLEPKWARAARERKIPFVLSVDAHSLPELDNARYAVAMARRAGVRRDEVLNAREANAFAEAVSPTGQRAA